MNIVAIEYNLKSLIIVFDDHRFHACSAIIRSLDPLYQQFKLQFREFYPELTIAIENLENFLR